jgi:UDP-N-acetylmuramoyl-tripeptide--D-alanyl-D-alanine ligase
LRFETEEKAEMTAALWTLDELVRATGGRVEGPLRGPITGVSIDTRSLARGDLFVALVDQRDGHEFVHKAFEAGASVALVSETYAAKPDDGTLLRVPDTLRGLEAIGRAARARLADDARVIGVTGSAGKTGTKEMLRACLSKLGETHAADKSFNNHWGVPLTLARMPASTRFGVFEIGMNHAGEITPLTRMVRPHVAIITTVEAVHLAQFNSVEDIAAAKAEIFLGLEPSGVAVLNLDNAHFDFLAKRADAVGAKVVSFGFDARADVRPLQIELQHEASAIEVEIGGRNSAYRVAVPGAHIARNSLAVAATLKSLGVDAATALQALTDLSPPPGRGARAELAVAGGTALLIDESYNANPASMRAALAVLGSVPRQRFQRRIAVIGDMLELGSEAPALHAGLKDAVDAAGVDLVFASGVEMAHLYEALPSAQKGAWAESSGELRDALLASVRPGDVLMVKGSFGSRMGPLAEALRARFGA